MPDYSGGAWGGAAAGIQDATKTAMDAIGGIDQIKANQAVQDQAKTQQALSQFQLTQAKAKAERADKPMYEDDFQGFAKDHPATYALMQQASMPYMQSDPAGKKFIRTEDAQNVMKMFSSEKTLEMKMGSAFYQDTVAQIENLKKQAAELQEKGDDKSKEALKGISDKMKTLDEQREQLRKQLTPKEEKGEVVPSGGAYIPPGETQPSYTNPKEQGNQTREQLTARALKGDKEALAVLDSMQARDLDVAKAKGAISISVAGPKAEAAATGKNKADQKTGTQGGFAKQSEEDKTFWYQSYEKNQKVPPFAYRDAESRNAFTAGYAEYERQKGNTGADAAASQALFKAQQAALQDVTKRKGLVSTFVNRIDETSKVVEDAVRKYDLQNPRFINKGINALEGVMGSGELAALKLKLYSLEQEVGKVEKGSLGVAGLDVEASKEMAKIHDVNLSVDDLLKVIKAGKELGGTATRAMNTSQKDIEEEMKGKGKGSGNAAVMNEPDARKALLAKGIRGKKEQDDWIQKYKDAGVVK